jgi:haloalkane dehalogenase
MFERYTEKARRVIFFARYEASQFGSVSIEPEHILLGLLREDRYLVEHFFPEPAAAAESIRKEIEQRMPLREKLPASVDLPLSPQAKRVLNLADEESSGLGHRNIGTGHLLLGILREPKTIAGEILQERGLILDKVREEIRMNFQYEGAGAAPGGITDVGTLEAHRLQAITSALAFGSLGSDFSGTFPFQSLYFKTPDGQMAYVDQGQGEPIVMLHGNPTWGYLYRKFIPPIASRHRAIAVDHLGFGRSEKAPRMLRLQDHIRNFSELALNLDLKNVTLVMQDWGGPIGLGFATRHPKRIKRLVIMNTWAFRIAAGTQLHPLLEQFRTPGIGEALVQGMNLFVEGFLPAGIHRPERRDPIMMAAYRAPFPDFNSRAPILAFPRDIPVGDNHPSSAVMGAIQDNLHRLQVPALIVWGTHDIAIPPQLIQARWLRYFPNAEVHLLDTASHFLQEDEPEQIISLILDFIAHHPVI